MSLKVLIVKFVTAFFFSIGGILLGMFYRNFSCYYDGIVGSLCLILGSWLLLPPSECFSRKKDSKSKNNKKSDDN